MPRVPVFILVVALSLPVPALSAQEKSPGQAFGLSFLGTAFPVAGGIMMAREATNEGWGLAMMLAGGMIGPAFGHFYAEQPERGWGGIAIRGAIIGGTLLAAGSTHDYGASMEAAVTGLAFLGAAVIVDIIASQGSARKTNRERGFAFNPSVQVVGDQRKVGVRIQLRW